MSAWAMAAVRTGIQAGWALLAVWAAREVPWVPLPDVPPGWVEIAVGALAAGTVTAGIGWLERRSRGTWWGRLGTRVGRVMMCGIVQQPTYTARGKVPL
jgi:purine-cytosine permease-like protein